MKRSSPPAPRLTLLDRAIGALAPIWGLRRAGARARLSAMQGLWGTVPRAGAAQKGTLGNWLVSRRSAAMAETERQKVAIRAQDLVANDSHAAAAVGTLTTHAVGRGLIPQSHPHARLGLSEDEAQAFSDSAEWAWQLWARRADTSGTLTFYDVQALNMRWMAVSGDYLNLVTMSDDPQRRISLALQVLDPDRLRTPPGAPANVYDGIELGPGRRPLAYHLADPGEGRWAAAMAREYRRVPARQGYRPAVLHGFMATEPEMVRGISLLAPAMKSFRDLGDYLDFELVSAIMAASFAVWFETTNPAGIVPNLQGVQDQDTTTGDRPQELSPGMIAWGPEKPHILESKRPSGTAEVFTSVMERVMAASMGLPHLAVTKDYGEANYSSARAALLDLWKTVELCRFHHVDHLCQPVWRMVLEEAYLKDMLAIPKSAPGFYSHLDEWTAATWIGPPRGHIDPVKEIEAAVIGLTNHIMTLADVVAEQGGDWADRLHQRSREEGLVSKLKLSGNPQTRQQITGKARTEDTEDAAAA